MAFMSKENDNEPVTDPVLPQTTCPDPPIPDIVVPDPKPNTAVPPSTTLPAVAVPSPTILAPTKVMTARNNLETQKCAAPGGMVADDWKEVK
jgi:hypothetical protein